MDSFVQDLRFALRQFRRHPGFTLVAVLTLALGIGANTAIFSLVDGILLRPLPYTVPERLVVFVQSYPSVGLERWGLSPYLFASLRDQTASFGRSAAYTGRGVNLTGVYEPVRREAGLVTAEFFDVLGVSPVLGRTFLPEEDVPGSNNACILSDRLWRGHFGGAADIVGRSVWLDGAPHEVVGVMPPALQLPSPETDLWIPLGLDPERRFGFMYTGIARLKGGVSADEAEAETTNIQWNLARQGENPPPEGADMRMIVMPLHEAITRTARTPLLVLLGAVGCVLLVACANIANLLLARLAAREREMAMRMALGSSPRRSIAQLLTESLLLALGGAAAGVALAIWIVELIGRLPLQGIPRIQGVQVNAQALLFTAALAALTALLFGLAPALHACRLGPGGGLRERVRSTASPPRRRLNHSLVATQVALSVVLLTGAGLLLKSFAHLVSVDPGFRPENLLTLRLSLPGPSYGTPEAMIGFYDALAERVRGLPGVRAAGLASSLPIRSDGWADGYVVEGHPRPGMVPPNALIRVTLPGYFHAVGIPQLRGRDFSRTDRSTAEPVAIVDEALARQYWPDGNALGGRIRFGWDTSERAWMTIVGVVGNVKHAGLVESAYPHLYLPYGQGGDGNVQQLHLAVRTESEAGPATATIRALVRELDPDLPVFDVRTMPEIVATSLNGQRLTNLLLGAFAATALLLAALGVYGVMSLEVRGRTREFGIRVAVGARRSDLFRIVVGRAMRIVATGMLVGMLGAFGTTHFLAALLFEVSTVDPATFGGAAGFLAAAAFAACYWPARWAAQVDPVVALRNE